MLTTPLPIRCRLLPFSALLLVGCSAGPLQRTQPSDAQSMPIETPTQPFVSPARWDYHPGAPDYALASLRLNDKSCVLTAEGGQRWTVTPTKLPVASNTAAADEASCIGHGLVSAFPAPEELVDIVRRSPTSWLFVGASGTIYEATNALGPFLRTMTPPEPLTKIAGVGGLLLAATRDGGLLRWQQGKGWSAVSLDASRPVRQRIFDVAVAEGGKALALAVPEALYATEDLGESWVRSPLSSMGLSRVGVGETGELLAQGLLSSTAWNPKGNPPFSQSNGVLSNSQLDLNVEVSRTPSAQAVKFGRAVMTSDRYYEAIRPDESGDEWRMARGAIDKPLEVKPIPNTTECGSIKLGANGKNIVLVCVMLVGEDILAEVRRSDDAGDHWQSGVKLGTADVDKIGIAVAPDGTTLLTGVCKLSDASSECKPNAPILLRLDGNKMMSNVSATPTLGGSASLPAFSLDGRSAYFVGYRVKDERLALFVSHDGGETFSPRPLERSQAPTPAARTPEIDLDVDEDEPEPPSPQSKNFDLIEDTWVRPSEDGVVGMLLASGDATVYVTTDDDGRILSVAELPADNAFVSGVGRRVIAAASVTARGGSNREMLQLWESMDGGMSWAELPENLALSHDFISGSTAMVCATSCCLLGDTVTRVGWGGQVEAAPESTADTSPRREPAARTPIVCEMAPKSKWTRIDHIEGTASGLPTGNETMRGRSVWSVMTRDADSAVRAISAILPESATGSSNIVTRSMFAAVGKGSKVATYISTQMEGYAAARIRLPQGADDDVPAGLPMRNVEIAWENWMDGTSGRGVIADAGRFEDGDIKGGVFDPALLSVSVRGLFVRPHVNGAQSALTFFFAPGQKLQRFDYPSFPKSALGQSFEAIGDAVMADGQPVAVGMIRADGGSPITTLLLAHRAASASSKTQGAAAAWDINAVTVAPPTTTTGDVLVYVDWSYANGMLGVTTLFVDTKRARGWANFQAFRGDGTLGAAQPLPTPFELTDPPRACTAQERATTARLEAPMFLRGEPLFSGTRHPVVVLDAAEPVTLLTSSAVLHGTPASPCIAGWEANALGRIPITAILPADLNDAWLFRSVSGTPGSNSTEVRPIKCRFDPSTKVAEGVWREPAMSR